MENLSLIEKYYSDFFYKIHNEINDFDTLLIATKILEIAKDRLINDLKNNEIKKEYNKLNEIIKELNHIIENYV